MLAAFSFRCWPFNGDVSSKVTIGSIALSFVIVFVVEKLGHLEELCFEKERLEKAR